MSTLEVVNDLLIHQLGEIEYRDATALQEGLRGEVHAGTSPELLLLLEHPPVYTRGRRSDDQELSHPAEWYRKKGIDVIQTDRGGKLTYHGPGQLVGYPIMRITDVIAYLRTMEAAIIASLATCGITGHSREGKDFTGVWVEDRKIASIGIHVQRGITTHGFAINVNNDLAPFTWVVACGLPGVSMTSVAQETGETVDLAEFRKVVASEFARAFSRSLATASFSRR